MLESRRAILLDILDLKRRLLDVYMELLAEHDSTSRRRPRGQEQPSTTTPRTVRVDAGSGYLRAITMPAARGAWPTLVTSNRRQITAHTSDQMYVTAILSASLAARTSAAPLGGSSGQWHHPSYNSRRTADYGEHLWRCLKLPDGRWNFEGSYDCHRNIHMPFLKWFFLYVPI